GHHQPRGTEGRGHLLGNNPRHLSPPDHPDELRGAGDGGDPPGPRQGPRQEPARSLRPLVPPAPLAEEAPPHHHGQGACVQVSVVRQQPHPQRPAESGSLRQRRRRRPAPQASDPRSQDIPHLRHRGRPGPQEGAGRGRQSLRGIDASTTACAVSVTSTLDTKTRDDRRSRKTGDFKKLMTERFGVEMVECRSQVD
ncbi:hypothetical protein CTA2_2221, partial [Colletotrichum tanaceti]